MSKKRKTSPGLLDLIHSKMDEKRPSWILGNIVEHAVCDLCAELNPSCEAADREFTQAVEHVRELLNALDLDEEEHRKIRVAIADVSNKATGRMVAYTDALFDAFVHTIGRRTLPWLFQKGE